MKLYLANFPVEASELLLSTSASLVILHDVKGKLKVSHLL